MEQINIMNELIKLGLEFLRKQAFSVVLLVLGLLALGYQSREQKAEFNTQLAVLDLKLTKCGEAREADGAVIRGLLVDLATVKEQVRLMKLTPRLN